MELAQLPPLANADFDQFYRYGAVAALLKPLLRGLGRPARILEVGCNVLNFLPAALDPLPVELTRCDVTPCANGDDFVLVRRDAPLPFAAGAFDFVVALEVLEHVPPEDRLFAAGEWLRVASAGLLLTCPSGDPAVRRAERRAERAYRRRNGRPHQWLREHCQYGLPGSDEVAALFARLGATCHVFDNCPLAEWLPLLLLTEELTETAAPDLVAHFNQLLNSRQPPLFTRHRPYRHVYACFKDAEQAHAAARRWHAAGIGTPADGEADPVVSLAGTLCRVFQEQARTADAALRRAEEQSEQARQELAAVQRVLADTTARLRRYELEVVRLARAANDQPVGPAPTELDAGAPHQLRRVSGPGVGWWEALGNDPQLVLARSLPAGWVEVRVAGQFPAGALSKLYYDCGTGFHERDCILLGPWGDADSLVRFHRFPAPVRALRFDPMEEPGPFRVFAFSVRPCGKLRLLRAALARHLRECRHPARLVRKSVHAARLLVRGRRAALVRGLLAPIVAPPQRPAGLDDPPSYAEWIEANRFSAEARREIEDRLARLDRPPTVTVALLVSRLREDDLERTLRSVAAQFCAPRELLIAASEADLRAVGTLLRRKCWRSLPVRLIPVPAAPAEAFARLFDEARGEFLVPVDAGDQLAPEALLVLTDAAAGAPAKDFFYSDEDRWDPEAGRCEPHFKPDWSPDYYRAEPYTGRLSAYRVSACRQLGNFGSSPTDDAEHELVLRLAADDGHNVGHVPRVLYHRAISSGSWAVANGQSSPVDAASRAAPAGRVQEQAPRREGEPPPRASLARRGAPDLPEALRGADRSRPAAHGPLISIIIPTAGRAAQIRGRETPFVANCVESIRRLTTCTRYEVLAVDNGDLPDDLARQLDGWGVRRITFREPFNLAAKINLGAAHAAGEYLVLLNDDTEVITPDWLDALLAYARLPGVGAVGAKLVFPDGRLQHVGVLLLDDGPSHPWYLAPGDCPGYYRSTLTPRNYLAVTGACLMTPRALFTDLGGFDLRFPLNYNDVDYCLRLVERGQRIVWTPHARLYHYEGVSKEGGCTVQPAERDLFRQLWGARYPRDPFYNPNLSAKHGDYRLRTIGTADTCG